jgi:hypothetical protein
MRDALVVARGELEVARDDCKTARATLPLGAMARKNH